MKIFLLITLSLICSAQSFEVASIRQHEGAISSIGTSIDGTRVTTTASVYSLIADAYDLKSYEVSGIPIPNTLQPKEFYDISARAPGDEPLTIAQVRKMYQALLAERFHLKFHRETRQIDVYALIAAKNGPKLGESSQPEFSMFMNSTGTNFKGAPLSRLALHLSGQPGIDRPVIDKTGIAGAYDFQLNSTLDRNEHQLTGPDGESIFTALEEQLGLKLEKQKAPIEVLVVDSVQKPSEN